MLTKAQKENQARFKAVQAKAKELKAKSPKLTHIEAVKKAWALMPGKGIVKKTIKVKKMPIAGKLNLTGKETRLGYVPKKVTAKKVAAVKKPMVSKHKDTKSHNVNIKVVSGLSSTFYTSEASFAIIDDIIETKKKLKTFEQMANNHNAAIKRPINKIYVPNLKKQLISINNYVKELKAHLKELEILLKKS